MVSANPILRRYSLRRVESLDEHTGLLWQCFGAQMAWFGKPRHSIPSPFMSLSDLWSPALRRVHTIGISIAVSLPQLEAGSVTLARSSAVMACLALRSPFGINLAPDPQLFVSGVITIWVLLPATSMGDRICSRSLFIPFPTASFPVWVLGNPLRDIGMVASYPAKYVLAVHPNHTSKSRGVTVSGFYRSALSVP